MAYELVILKSSRDDADDPADENHRPESEKARDDRGDVPLGR